jgi:hypothetical protein
MELAANRQKIGPELRWSRGVDCGDDVIAAEE